MREILFRGKNFDNGVWVQGYYVSLNGNKHFIYTGQSDVDCGNYYPDYYPVAAKTVGQFTGLTDKNGKKIFEGDIVNYGDFLMVIVWDEFFSSFMLAFSLDGNYHETMSNSHIYLEVIGNIHDNPELIGGDGNGSKENVR